MAEKWCLEYGLFEKEKVYQKQNHMINIINRLFKSKINWIN